MEHVATEVVWAKRPTSLSLPLLHVQWSTMKAVSCQGLSICGGTAQCHASMAKPTENGSDTRPWFRNAATGKQIRLVKTRHKLGGTCHPTIPPTPLCPLYVVPDAQLKRWSGVGYQQPPFRALFPIQSVVRISGWFWFSFKKKAQTWVGCLQGALACNYKLLISRNTAAEKMSQSRGGVGVPL